MKLTENGKCKSLQCK